MYARRLALFSLLSVSISMGWSESTLPASSEVEVYIKGDLISSSAWSGLTRELSAVMQGAGFRILLRRSNDGSSSLGADHLVMVELRGTCAVPPTGTILAPPIPFMPLASTAVVDGRVLPFSWLDCTALNQFLAPAIAGLTQTDQERLYERSMARLLAHEFYHVLAQTDDHTLAGISKPRFSIADLLADHFDFESSALARLHPAPVSGGDDASSGGR